MRNGKAPTGKIQIGQIIFFIMFCNDCLDKRLGVRTSDSGGASSTWPFPYTLSSKAGNVAPGDTKYYQCWYRNPLNSPCGYQFNTTNGYAVTWLP